MSIPLERTDDILGWVEKNRHPGLFVCGFSMETENMVENSRAKLEKKHLDMIAANNLKTEGAGFGVATNVVTLITKDGIKELPLMGKDEVMKTAQICFPRCRKTGSGVSSMSRQIWNHWKIQEN